MALDKYMGFPALKSSCVLGQRDPDTLWEEIIDLIPEEVLTNPQVRVLNVAAGFGTEARILAKRMLKLGVPLEQVRDAVYVLDADGTLVDDIRFNSGFKHCIEADFINWQTDMKFDIIIGNPPFSKQNEGKTAGKKAVNLYPKFYEKAVALADMVYMIMPDTGKQVNAGHNKKLKATAFDIRPISGEEFPGVGIKMWVAFYDKNKKANVDDHFLEFKVSNSLDFKKGPVNLSCLKHSVSETGTRVIKALYKNEGVIEEFVTEGVISDKHRLPSDGFVVLMPLTLPDSGWRVEIEPCARQAVNVNVYFMVTQSLDEAETLKTTVTSEQFISQAKTKRGNQNVITISALRSIEL